MRLIRDWEDSIKTLKVIDEVTKKVLFSKVFDSYPNVTINDRKCFVKIEDNFYVVENDNFVKKDYKDYCSYNDYFAFLNKDLKSSDIWVKDYSSDKFEFVLKVDKIFRNFNKVKGTAGLKSLTYNDEKRVGLESNLIVINDINPTVFTVYDYKDKKFLCEDIQCDSVDMLYNVCSNKMDEKFKKTLAINKNYNIVNLMIDNKVVFKQDFLKISKFFSTDKKFILEIYSDENHYKFYDLETRSFINTDKTDRLYNTIEVGKNKFYIKEDMKTYINLYDEDFNFIKKCDKVLDLKNFIILNENGKSNLYNKNNLIDKIDFEINGKALHLRTVIEDKLLYIWTDKEIVFINEKAEIVIEERFKQLLRIKSGKESVTLLITKNLKYKLLITNKDNSFEVTTFKQADYRADVSLIETILRECLLTKDEIINFIQNETFTISTLTDLKSTAKMIYQYQTITLAEYEEIKTALKLDIDIEFYPKNPKKDFFVLRKKIEKKDKEKYLALSSLTNYLNSDDFKIWSD